MHRYKYLSAIVATVLYYLWLLLYYVSYNINTMCHWILYIYCYLSMLQCYSYARIDYLRTRCSHPTCRVPVAPLQ